MQYDGPPIELGCHVMHAGSMLKVACGQRTFMRMQAFVPWQQRGMDVEQSTGVVCDKARRQHAHEAGQHDQFGAAGVDGLHQCGFKCVAIKLSARTEVGSGNGACGNALTDTPRQGAGIFAVAQYLHDGGCKSAACTARSNGSKVAAAARNQHRQPQRRAACRHCVMTTPRVPRSMLPMRVAVSPCARSSASAASASPGATMTTMPMPQLKVRYIS